MVGGAALIAITWLTRTNQAPGLILILGSLLPPSLRGRRRPAAVAVVVFMMLVLAIPPTTSSSGGGWPFCPHRPMSVCL